MTGGVFLEYDREMENRVRNCELVVRSFSGESYALLGKEHGITRERVRQILMIFLRKGLIEGVRTKREAEKWWGE